MPDELFAFDEEHARRIAAAVRYVERLQSSRPSHRRRTPVIHGGGDDIGCRLSNGGSSQNISASATATLTFSGEDYDTDTMHDNVTNTSRITIQTNGKYFLWFGFRGSFGVTPPAANSFIKSTVLKNGTATDHIDVREVTYASGSGSAYYAQLGLAVEDSCVSGDYLEVSVQNGDTYATLEVSKQHFGARKVDAAG